MNRRPAVGSGGAPPAGCDDPAVLARLAQVLDPELDEPILDLGFVRSVAIDSRHARIELRLPTSWCAVNFAYLMAEDVRRALLALDGIDEVSVSLGDHCAAAAIEAAVNTGRSFAEAFPAEGGGSLAALRLTFLRKGFVIRQERLLRALHAAGFSPPTICALPLGTVWIVGETIVIRQPDAEPIKVGPAALLRRYLERRDELGLDCGRTAPLIVGLDGEPLSAEGLRVQYETARTMRVALEANGAFCRALSSVRAAEPSAQAKRGGRDVQA
jgi:metal-sulfur cluster biosynthetic enzyme